MKAKFGIIKEFKQAYALPPVGNFALDVESPKTPNWDHCREQFATKFNEETPGFFYSVNSGNGEDVASFLTKCEEVINIQDLNKQHEHSVFNKTDKDCILWIVPSIFWLNCEMKRSFLTMILRCGLNYNQSKDNFDEALFSESYKENRWARETKAATLRFLFGFTRWTGVRYAEGNGKHGWHEEFRASDNLNIRKKLALPEGEVREASIIGVESLWA